MKTEDDHRSKKFDRVCYHCSRNGHMSQTAKKEKLFIRKSMRKEKAIDENKGDLVLCLLTMEIKKENVKKNVQFTEDVKKPMEAGMMCTINGDTFFCSQRTYGLETPVHHVTS